MDVRCGRLRWFGHLERKSGDDWVSACRNVEVAGERCVGRGRKTWRERVNDDMKLLGLQLEWEVFRDMWRGFISGQTSNLSWVWKKLTFSKWNDEWNSYGDSKLFKIIRPSIITYMHVPFCLFQMRGQSERVRQVLPEMLHLLFVLPREDAEVPQPECLYTDRWVEAVSALCIRLIFHEFNCFF